MKNNNESVRKIAILAVGKDHFEVDGCYLGDERKPRWYTISHVGSNSTSWMRVDNLPTQNTLRRLFPTN